VNPFEMFLLLCGLAMFKSVHYNKRIVYVPACGECLMAGAIQQSVKNVWVGRASLPVIACGVIIRMAGRDTHPTQTFLFSKEI